MWNFAGKSGFAAGHNAPAIPAGKCFLPVRFTSLRITERGMKKQTAPFSGAVCSQFGYVGAVYAAAIAGALFPDAVGAVRRAGFDAVAASLFSASLSMASAFLTMRLR